MRTRQKPRFTKDCPPVSSDERRPAAPKSLEQLIRPSWAVLRVNRAQGAAFRIKKPPARKPKFASRFNAVFRLILPSTPRAKNIQLPLFRNVWLVHGIPPR
jgi:hypothetical protein